MEEESREGMLEYQKDKKRLHRAKRKIRAQDPVKRPERTCMSNNNFSHGINYCNTVDIINKISVNIHYCTITGKMHLRWNLFIMDTLGPAISGSFLQVFLYQR